MPFFLSVPMSTCEDIPDAFPLQIRKPIPGVQIKGCGLATEAQTFFSLCKLNSFSVLGCESLQSLLLPSESCHLNIMEAYNATQQLNCYQIFKPRERTALRYATPFPALVIFIGFLTSSCLKSCIMWVTTTIFFSQIGPRNQVIPVKICLRLFRPLKGGSMVFISSA